ncbi:cytochrome cbb3 oxidase maturation protein CcoH [Flavobacterium limnosediminis JC2902]|uniref:Cytochrome cbb3 oxidase maturation protein CcoH n=1 Tax=Flavobacterium limnosediminis JC2902 TaxID=1341181 RepID=V6SPE5_9FLAO|nr:FixH family protein [Flavobacterium limnosediminis]ESU28309.1 cytochrome cbb3 oxidase maturation protein CcoH [Flavobacterium limnosediminis JC2902]
MKINWGTGIVIAFALFMTFILYFVFKVQSDSQYDHEMVTEEYYKKELNFQHQIDKQQNANSLSERVRIESNNEGLLIVFPKDFDITKIKGKVSLYRPSNQKLDFEVPISLSTSNLLIPKTDLVGGRWDIAVEWEYEGKEYLNKKEVSL